MKEWTSRKCAGLLSVVCFTTFVGPISEVATAAPKRLNPLQIAWQSSISSQADLDRVTAQLKQPGTRLNSLRVLMDFVGLRLYPRGSVFIADDNPAWSPEHNQMVGELRDKAVKAIWANADFNTVREVIEGTDQELRYWGLWVYDHQVWKDVPASEAVTTTSERFALLPKIEELAMSGDEVTRRAAVEILQKRSGFESFLAERLEVETSPDIVLRLTYRTNKAEFSAKFNPYLLRLLNRPEEEVRRQALEFVWLNYFSAPMWKITFDQPVIDKVKGLAKSESKSEKEAALCAIEWMQKAPMSEQ